MALKKVVRVHWFLFLFAFSNIAISAKSNINSNEFKFDRSIFSSLVFDENEFEIESESGQLKPVFSYENNNKGIKELQKIYTTDFSESQEEPPKKAPVNTANKTVETERTAKTKKSQNELPKVLRNWEFPPSQSDKAQVYVVDEDAYLLGLVRPLNDVSIYWIHQDSGLKTQSNAQGIAQSPYPETQSIRFIAHKEGFLPAIGYAVKGQVNVVILYRESRLAPLLTGLNIGVEHNKHILIGKVIDENYRPLQDVQIHISEEDPAKVHYYTYSIFGTHKREEIHTGVQGNFLVNRLDSELQYLIPYLDNEKLPVALVDLKSLPPVLSITIRDSAPKRIETQVVDAFQMERPNTGIRVDVGGQKMPHVPDDLGTVELEHLFEKNFLDIVEIEANGYKKTWISSLNDEDHFPPYIGLFSPAKIKKILQNDLRDSNLKLGIVMGHLSHNRFKNPVQISVFNSAGKISKSARVLYFDSQNEINLRQDRTDAHFQNFAVTNLPDGEYHIVVRDPESGHGISSQVIRVSEDTITQVEI